jgi:hypothetical protein
MSLGNDSPRFGIHIGGGPRGFFFNTLCLRARDISAPLPLRDSVMKITPNRHLQTNLGSQAPMAYDELRDDTRDTSRCVVGPSCSIRCGTRCRLRCTVIALRAAVSVLLLHVFTDGNMLPLLTNCACCAFASGHGVWSVAEATLTWAIIVLEL